MKMKFLSVAFIIVFLISNFAYINTHAATILYSVNTTADTEDVSIGDNICADANGQCSLRAALSEVSDKITIDEQEIYIPNGNYIFSSPGTVASSLWYQTLSRITSNVRITGQSRSGTIINGSGIPAGNNTGLIFASNGANLDIQNLTITNMPYDVMLFQGDSLNMNNVNMTYNTGEHILRLAGSGDVALSNLNLTNNTNNSNGNMIIASVFNSGNALVSNVSITNNTAHTAIITSSESGKVKEFINNTISNNNAIPIDIQTLSSTSTGTLKVTNSTIASNSPQFGPSGVYLEGDDAQSSIEFKNTIFSKSSGANSLCLKRIDDLTQIISSGGNISHDTSCNSFFTNSSDKNNIDPLLAPLQFDQGTYVHKLRSASPAIDNGVSMGAPNVDQRGAARPIGAAIDSGSIEQEPYVDLELSASSTPTQPQLGQNTVLTYQITNTSSVSTAGVQVTFSIPTQFTYVSSSMSKGSFVTTSSVWNIGVMDPNEVQTIDLVLRADGAGISSVVGEINYSLLDDSDSIPNNNIPTEDDYASVEFDMRPTFTLTSTLDNVDNNPGDGRCMDVAGECTLRAAIMEINTLNNSQSTIIIPSGHYVLTRPGINEYNALTGDLNVCVNGDISIIGSGVSHTILDGNQLDRVLEFVCANIVTIKDLTITNGRADYGGGIASYPGYTSRVEIDRVNITNNSATTQDGGGVYHGGGILNVSNSNINNNFAQIKGAGIYSYRQLRIYNSSIISNTTHNFGGGIYSEGLELEVKYSTIADNTAQTGGGVYDRTYNNPSLYANVSIVHNTGIQSAGIHLDTSNASMLNTVLAENDSGADCDIESTTPGTISSLGHNVITNAGGCVGFSDPSDRTSVSNVGVLNDLYIPTGGSTYVARILSGSPLIDSADETLCELSDQNYMNIQDGDVNGQPRCDVGSHEYTPKADLQITDEIVDDVVLGGTITYKVMLTNNGPDAANNVQVANNIGTSFTQNGIFRIMDSYDPQTRIWYIDRISSGETKTLEIVLNVLNYTNSAISSEVYASGVFDPNSTPNNGVVTENDYVYRYMTINEQSLPVPEIQQNGNNPNSHSLTLTPVNTINIAKSAIDLIRTGGVDPLHRIDATWLWYSITFVLGMVSLRAYKEL